MTQYDKMIMSRKVTASYFQRQILIEFIDLLRLIRINETAGEHFEKREPTKILQFYSISEIYDELVKQICHIEKDFPKLDLMGKQLNTLLNIIIENDYNACILLDAYLQFSKLKNDYLHIKNSNSSSHIMLKADQKDIYIEVNPEYIDTIPELRDSLIDCVQSKKFFSTIMGICKEVRENERNFTNDEISGIWFAYSLLQKGITLDFSYRGLGTSGFRINHHTIIFSTDPGDDHIRISSMKKNLIDGVAIHVEHIDRDLIKDKEKIEAYRLPSAINTSKVRLHIADSAPVTTYIGRPVFENGNLDIQNRGGISQENYEMDKLKSVHMTSSACTTMFQNGVADCKIAIERMAISTAIDFMKSVVGNVVRDTARQTLAAAFNINTPIYDDINNKYINDRFNIAKEGIKIALAGRFDRVTWDGASKKIPSDPIIEQMTHQQFLQLVHLAHENGLETYFSAGLDAKHIYPCIITGVDGLGIGTSLHYFDSNTKLIGAFNPEAIEQILQKRNEAEQSILGKAAKLLAKLDRLYFEKTIYEEEESLRQELYNALLELNEDNAKRLYYCNRTDRVKNLPNECENPLISRGIRTIKFFDTKMIYKNGLSKEEEKNYDDIKAAILELDLNRLQNIYMKG